MAPEPMASPPRNPDDSIWKFQLGLLDAQQIVAPSGARVLTVQLQRGVPTLWMRVNIAADLEKRVVFVVGTGHQMPMLLDGSEYAGTFQLHGGDLVFHVWVSPCP